MGQPGMIEGQLLDGREEGKAQRLADFAGAAFAEFEGPGQIQPRWVGVEVGGVDQIQAIDPADVALLAEGF